MSGEGRPLIIRADAGTEMGAGHLMRCLALGQAWKDAGGKVIFITACQSEGLLQRLRDESFNIHELAIQHPDPGDWDNIKDILAVHPDAWLVLDGYHFDEAYQQKVKEIGNQLLVIDDMAHLNHYYADIVLNQNLHAEQMHYPCEPYTHLLLGTQYVLLRREFLSWKDWKRDIPEIARRVLVTMGGGDPKNHTLKVIRALQKVGLAGLEATVVVGAGNPHIEALERTVNESSFPIHVVYDANNMTELMAWADVAVCAAGSTVWELMFMGVPVILIAIAYNQEQIARSAAAQDVAFWVNHESANWIEILAEQLRRFILVRESRSKLIYRERSLVDGLGTMRVLQELYVSKSAKM